MKAIRNWLSDNPWFWVLAICGPMVGWMIVTVAEQEQSRMLAMRAYCEARFQAARTAEDTVAVLMDREDRWHCEYGLVEETVER